MQKGNALWFILVAIALLGLLTVMMSRSSSTTNESGNYERNVIAANEILSYAKSIENATQNLLARGCSENDISFWHDSDGNGTEDGSDDYYNANSPTDRSCHIFDVAGAGMRWETPNDDFFATSSYNIHVSPRHCIKNIGDFLTTCNSNQNNDIIFAIANLKKDICTTINNTVGIQNILNDAPEENISLTNFTGSFLDASASMIEGNFTGYTSGCLKDDTGSTTGLYFLYHVLHAR